MWCLSTAVMCGMYKCRRRSCFPGISGITQDFESEGERLNIELCSHPFLPVVEHLTLAQLVLHWGRVSLLPCDHVSLCSSFSLVLLCVFMHVFLLLLLLFSQPLCCRYQIVEVSAVFFKAAAISTLKSRPALNQLDWSLLLKASPCCPTHLFPVSV